MSRLPGNKYRSDPHAMGIPAGGILLTNQDEPPRATYDGREFFQPTPQELLFFFLARVARTKEPDLPTIAAETLGLCGVAMADANKLPYWPPIDSAADAIACTKGPSGRGATGHNRTAARRRLNPGLTPMDSTRLEFLRTIVEPPRRRHRQARLRRLAGRERPRRRGSTSGRTNPPAMLPRNGLAAAAGLSVDRRWERQCESRPALEAAGEGDSGDGRWAVEDAKGSIAI